MSVTIHGYAASINVRKVLWACEELGVAYQRQDRGGGHLSTQDPAFLGLNPLGLVPVLEDGAVVLSESNTIVRYLAARCARTDLLPAEPAARARVERWMDWQASDFNNSWRVAFQGLVRRNPAFQDPAAIEQSVRSFTSMVRIVDAQLGRTGAYVSGETFTVADIPIGLSLQRWLSLPIEHPALPDLQRYHARLLERPAFRRHGPGGGP